MRLAHCLSSGHVDTHKDEYEKDRNVWIGLLYLGVGFVCIPFVIIMLSAITRHPLKNYACFKLLTMLTVLDLANLLFSLLISGTFSLLDINHCNSGAWITTVGYISMVVWCAYCAASEILAINRLLQFWSKPLCNKLFHGKRCWLWVAIPMVYCVTINALGQPPFYYYDPHGGGWVLEDNGKPNYALFINNFFKFGFLLVVYSMMLVFLYKRTIEKPESVTNLQRSVAYQSLAVAMISSATTIVYICMQYLPRAATKYAPLVGHLFWVAANASTSMIYIMANRTVKRKLGRMFGMAEEAQREGTSTSLAHCLSSGQVDTHKDEYEKDRNVWIGFMYLSVGVVCIPFVLIMLSAITRHPLKNYACFKLLTMITVLDLANLVLSLLISGTLSYLNINHCNSGAWITTVGYMCMLVWCAYSAMSEILAINRLLEFWNKPLCKKLFQGKRCWLWAAFPMVYCLTLNVLGQLPFYYYDPHGGGWVLTAEDHGKPNYALFINNFFKFSFLLIVYSLMLFFLYKRTADKPESVSNLQKSVAYQSLAVAVISSAATIIYICIQYLPKAATKHAPLIGHLFWVASNASTSMIYIMANRTVKRKLGRIFGMAKQAQREGTIASVGVVATSESKK